MSAIPAASPLRPRAGRTRWRSFAASAALALSAFVGGALASRLSQATPQRESPYAPLGRLAEALVLVENDYVEPVERSKLLAGAVSGMVAALDPHSSYFDPEELRAFRSDTEGHFAGVGLELDLRDGALVVLTPIEGSPAARAGIRPGDRVVAVDGQPLDEATLGKTIRKVRGPAGTHIKLTLRRPQVTAAFVVDLVRAEIKVPSVRAKTLEHGILYLRIKMFQETTHDEMIDAIAKARREMAGAPRGVLLDMRNNPGGLVDQAAEVADELLDSGTLYSTRHRGAIVDDVKAEPGGALTRMPLVALVNAYSASAAELVAGSLQDNHRATIVGETTFGKGSVQTIFDLPEGAGLRLTTMRYYTPAGRSIQALGIQPDIVVRSTPSLGTGASANGARPAEPVRERDLEGHLAEERGAAATAPAEVAAATPELDLSLEPIDALPTDPSKSRDGALVVAYRALVDEQAPAAARPPATPAPPAAAKPPATAASPGAAKPPATTTPRPSVP